MIPSKICSHCKKSNNIGDMQWIKVWAMTANHTPVPETRIDKGFYNNELDSLKPFIDFTRREMVKQVIKDYDEEKHEGEQWLCKECSKKARIGVVFCE